MHSVFLSYRKSDTGLEASRLAQCLQPVFGRRIVFRDVDSIVPGSDWQAVLKGEVARAKVVLVLIGPAWVSELASRLERRDVDYHRVEMAIALAQGIPVIPILLRDAAPPPTSSLPDDLAPLIEHQAITMRDESWSEDVDRLVDAIGRPYRWDLLALRAVIALVAAPIALWWLVPQFAPDQDANYTLLRWVLVFLWSLYALVELTMGYRRYRQRQRSSVAANHTDRT